MRILPFRGTMERSGVVMTLIDNPCLKQAEVRFRNANQRDQRPRHLL